MAGSRRGLRLTSAAAEEKTASGIIIPDTAKEKPLKGKVIAAGTGKIDEPYSNQLDATVFHIQCELIDTLKELAIGLDDLELLLRSHGYVTMCGGTDQHLVVLTIDNGCAKTIANLLASQFKFNDHSTSVIEVPTFPLLPSGKTDYQFLMGLAKTKITESSIQLMLTRQFSPTTVKPQTGFKAWLKNKGLKTRLQLLPNVKPIKSQSVLEIFSKVFPSNTVTTQSSFESLGGDSFNYVQMLNLLENKFGELPRNWQTCPISH